MMSIMQMSLQAGLLIIAIILIRAAASNKLPKSIFSCLWGLALFRLLIPVSIPSRFSLYNIIDKLISSPDSANPIPSVRAQLLITENPPASLGSAMTLQAQKPASSLDAAYIIWLSVSFVIFILLLMLYRRSNKQLRLALPLHDKQFINAWLIEHKMSRPIQVMSSDRIRTPLAHGILRPRIILPKYMNLNDEQLLLHVLTHEYYHIRRFDALWKLALAVAVCVHWFNPLVWVMFGLLNRDLELACDEMVIRHLGENAKASYAYSLINMAQHRSKFSPLYTGFSKTATEERIISIMNIRKKTVLSTILSFALVSIMAVGFTTSTLAQGNPDELMTPTQQDSREPSSDSDKSIQAEGFDNDSSEESGTFFENWRSFLQYEVDAGRISQENAEALGARPTKAEIEQWAATEAWASYLEMIDSKGAENYTDEEFEALSANWRSYLQEEVNAGRLSQEEMRTHSRRYMLEREYYKVRAEIERLQILTMERQQQYMEQLTLAEPLEYYEIKPLE